MATEFETAMAALSPRKQEFVKFYLKHGRLKQAAIDAGYSENGASSRAQALKHDTKVVAALKAHGKECAAEIKYETEDAMRELERLIPLAVENKQFAAVATMVTLKAKLKGLLVEKHLVHVKEAIDLEQAHKAALERLPPDVRQAIQPTAPVIEGEVNEPEESGATNA